MNSRFNTFAVFVIIAINFIDKVTSAPEPLVNAKLAGKGEFGYHVSVELMNISICGGGIIDDRHVVTAAHCLIDHENEFLGYPLKVIVGTEDLNIECKRRVAIDVQEAFIPAEYDTRHLKKKNRPTGDIAVLKLKADLGLKKHKYLQKLQLPTNDKDYHGQKVVVTGFGFNEYDESKKFSAEECGSRDNKLRFAKAMVISNDKCQALRKKRINEKHLCAASIQFDPKNPTGVCDGDSGGPLVYKNNRLIGIVSSSPKNCQEDQAPAVYTKVWPFVDFITNVLKGRIDKSIRLITLVPYDQSPISNETTKPKLPSWAKFINIKYSHFPRF